MFLKQLAAAVLTLPCLCLPVLAEPASPLVQDFAQAAGLSNQFEIAESRLALEKSADPLIRQFAGQMIHDHTEAQMQLRQASMASAVTADFMFDNARQAQVDALDSKSGTDFDSAYLADQKDAHAATLDTLSAYAASGEDPSLRMWARATMPTVAMHQRMLADMPSN